MYSRLCQEKDGGNTINTNGLLTYGKIAAENQAMTIIVLPHLRPHLYTKLRIL